MGGCLNTAIAEISVRVWDQLFDCPLTRPFSVFVALFDKKLALVCLIPRFGKDASVSETVRKGSKLQKIPQMSRNYRRTLNSYIIKPNVAANPSYQVKVQTSKKAPAAVNPRFAEVIEFSKKMRSADTALRDLKIRANYRLYVSRSSLNSWYFVFPGLPSHPISGPSIRVNSASNHII